MEKKQKGILEGLSFTQHLLSATVGHGQKAYIKESGRGFIPKELRVGRARQSIWTMTMKA